ncbi:hypothetical protein RUM44_007389 [Polyplax serrata]|uniref:Uncharacterized protein n=1 Tax=Polyplax serrata TaxID=468196 RepID=A0ABR1B0J6_POLSC
MASARQIALPFPRLKSIKTNFKGCPTREISLLREGEKVAGSEMLKANESEYCYRERINLPPEGTVKPSDDQVTCDRQSVPVPTTNLHSVNKVNTEFEYHVLHQFIFF